MVPHPHDTIVALSSAPGPGGRAIVRLSGSAALRIAASLLDEPVDFTRLPRGIHAGQTLLPGVSSPLPVELYVGRAPQTYTGQDMMEVHLLSCPPLVDLLISQLLAAGARAAQAGEFTLRAFLAGKLDLTRAEAVLGVIEAGNRDELKHALTQLAGGMAQPLHELRDELLNLLADVEAGLDFADEDIHFTSQEELLKRLGKGLALVTLLGKQIERRALADRPFRVVLAGRPNAGKSSLFNALAGSAAALVSARPGTTRDYLVQRLELDGVAIELIDTAGWHATNGTIEAQAQRLGLEQAEQADLVLLCLEAGQTSEKADDALLQRQKPPVIPVATKCDLHSAPPGGLATSAIQQTGLGELRTLLAERARLHSRPALAPSLSRCRHHVAACLGHLRRAHATVLFEEPPELLALALRESVDELGEMVGAVYTDDLLDRIFSRFCIGK